MQYGLIEGRIGRVSVGFPVLVDQIELDVATLDFAAIDPDGGVGKIGAGFAIPDAELYDLNLLTRHAGE